MIRDIRDNTKNKELTTVTLASALALSSSFAFAQFCSTQVERHERCIELYTARRLACRHVPGFVDNIRARANKNSSANIASPEPTTVDHLVRRTHQVRKDFSRWRKTASGELRELGMLMRPRHSLDRLLTLKASGVHDLMGSFTAPTLRKKCLLTLGCSAGQSRAFYSFVTACRASKLGPTS
jgi:hypothetical protein